MHFSTVDISAYVLFIPIYSFHRKFKLKLFSSPLHGLSSCGKPWKHLTHLLLFLIEGRNRKRKYVVVCTLSSVTDKLSAGCQNELVCREDERDGSSCSPGTLSTCVFSVMKRFRACIARCLLNM